MLEFNMEVLLHSLRSGHLHSLIAAGYSLRLLQPVCIFLHICERYKTDIYTK